MAFLDNPTIILAHIRQSHVTSDDTGMCEMVLIDHDVDLEKIHPPSMTGDSGSDIQGSNGETQGYVYAQSVDITSSWDFGIRRRSNTGKHCLLVMSSELYITKQSYRIMRNVGLDLMGKSQCVNQEYACINTKNGSKQYVHLHY